jgi:cardiolipin hydrolase
MTASEPVGDLLELLAATLGDSRLSDDERRALALTLRQNPPREEDLRRLRNHAFDLVRGRLNDPELRGLLKWLEGIVRTLDGGRVAAGEGRSTAFFSPGPDCVDAIRTRLRSTKSHAELCVFTISDDRISDEVLAAHRRGVSLRLITDNEKEFDRGSDIGRFRDAGIAIVVDRTAAHMHHKFAIFDAKWLLNGSYNWTRGAAEANEENLVLSQDADLLRQFSAQFESLWNTLREGKNREAGIA